MNADEEDLMRGGGGGKRGLLFANGLDRSKLLAAATTRQGDANAICGRGGGGCKFKNRN